eukprot:gene9291-10255_t
MYAIEAKKPFQLPGSPSFLPNNLSSALNGALTYVKTNDVYLVKANGESTRLPVARSKVYQSKFVQVQGHSLIAITSDLGVQLWTADGDNMLFYQALATVLGSSGEEDGRFMRGITGQDTFLCVGCSTGGIAVFDCSKDLHKGQFPLLHVLEGKGHAIYALSSSPSFLSASDENGNLMLYRIDSAFELVFSISGKGVPCTALLNTDHVVVAGFASGHIRVYRIDTRELAVEITAHARLITGLTYHPEMQLAASCSADQYVHVWSVPNFRSMANSSMDCVFSHRLENRVCTGVAFQGNDKVSVTCYDEDDLVVFNRL